jgi:hypothetical protein
MTALVRREVFQLDCQILESGFTLLKRYLVGADSLNYVDQGWYVTLAV